MNKVLKGLVAVAATAAMAVAGFAGASTAMAADTTYKVSVDSTDSHTYDAYQCLLVLWHRTEPLCLTSSGVLTRSVPKA